MQRTSPTSRALTGATLSEHAARVQVPAYDRSLLRPAVVHVSVGQFHRSHQAVYFDELAQRGITQDWGVVGIGLRSPRMRDVLRAQDGLYTVVTRSAECDAARVVGVMGRYLFAPDDPGAVVDALADARTQLVTLTLTGPGYEEASQARPDSVWAYLVEALVRRRAAGLPPFTVLSCDNLLDNGALARIALVGCARRRDAELAAWIEEHVACPSSMVDRITPSTTPADVSWVAREFGVRDRWPVLTEAFSQWVIEDSFSGERPPLDAVGVQFVPDVRPYAVVKTRMLNASHVAIGVLGSLAGMRSIDQAVAEPVLGAYAERFLEEVRPLLPGVPGLDLDAYQQSLLDRFANPKVADQLSRLRRCGSSKVPRHLLSSIAEARAAGLPHDLLTTAVAGWVLMLRGIDEAGRPLSLDDPMGDRLQALALIGRFDLRPLLAEWAVFGALGRDRGFAAQLAAAVRSLERHGVHATLHRLLRTDTALPA